MVYKKRCNLQKKYVNLCILECSREGCSYFSHYSLGRQWVDIVALKLKGDAPFYGKSV